MEADKLLISQLYIILGGNIPSIATTKPDNNNKRRRLFLTMNSRDYSSLISSTEFKYLQII